MAHTDPTQDHLADILVRSTHTVVNYRMDSQDVPHVLHELLRTNPRKHHSQPLRLLNVYSRPRNRHGWFDTLLAVTRRKGAVTLIASNFNAQHLTWGYFRVSAKRRHVHTLIQQHNLSLPAEPSTTTRATYGGADTAILGSSSNACRTDNWGDSQYCYPN